MLLTSLSQRKKLLMIFQNELVKNKATLYVFSTLLLVYLLGCKKHSSHNSPTCGCGSPVVQTLTDTGGNLQFETFNYFSNQPQYIVATGAGDFITSYYVCDTTGAIGEQLHTIVDTNRNNIYHVIFEGKVEKFCYGDSIGNLGGDTTFNIQLTSITIN